MYADTLLELERGHLLRLGLWAGISILVGVSVMVVLFLRKENNAAFLRHFAIQLLAWGAVDFVMAGWGWKGLALRDYASAMQLQKFLWLNVGLDAGYAGMGLTLALAAWLLGKRLRALGAGVGIVVQGAAMFVLDLRFLTAVETARIALGPLSAPNWLPV